MSSCALARLSTAIARKTLRRVSDQVWLKGIKHTQHWDHSGPSCHGVTTWCLNFRRGKDTVSKQREDDEVDRGEHATAHSSLRFDPMIHHCIPVLSCQNLQQKACLWPDLTPQQTPNIQGFKVYLEHRQNRCWEGVKVRCWGLVFKIKP